MPEMTESYIKLGLVALLPAALACLFDILDRKTPFKKLPYFIKQLIYGIFFGALAILGTERGIPMAGAQVNVRDGAVITAGLFFGAPAGIIAGLIGGIERWIAVAWGIGTFTRVACTLSTIIAGLFSAFLRKYLFEDKRTSWELSFATGIVIEVFHMTMVFLTNMKDPTQAMAVVKACSAPMILANGLAVGIAGIALTLINGKELLRRKGKKIISQTVQAWLLVVVAIAFFVTTWFLYCLQQEMAKSQAASTLSVACEETGADLRDMLDAGSSAAGITRNRHVGDNGFVLVYNGEGRLISKPYWLQTDMSDLSLLRDIPENSDDPYEYLVGQDKYLVRKVPANGYTIASFLPTDEAYQMRNIAIYVNTFLEVLVFGVLFVLINIIIKRVVVNQIQSVNKALGRITEGDLDERVNVRSNAEFDRLSDDINSTVDALNNYIAEAAARIDNELAFAKDIQFSSLPKLTPALANRKEFDIATHIETAKEVGGDFYDYYLTNSNTINFLIADVSGKGIPAAMFMMRAKTELRTLTESALHLGDVFTTGNHALCEGNDAGMFVTAWQGEIDLSSGIASFVNAGHNPPLVKRAGGEFSYLKMRAGFVLAGMDGVNYKENTVQLGAGDWILLYTDGITEATNAACELYGEERLLALLNSREFDTPDDLCAAVMEDVNRFVGDAPQFDDITMLALRYNGAVKAPSIHFDNAAIADIPAVTEFVEAELDKLDCPMAARARLCVAVDEIYSNIAKYAYPNGSGPATVEVVELENPHAIRISFTDEGTPYNPLTEREPDTTLSAEERKIGGLGIHMVKRTMDDLQYRYVEEKNITIIQKNI